jgi:hypothetical protein
MTGKVQSNSAITTAAQFVNSLICNPTPPAQRVLPAFINCADLIADVSQANAFSSTDVSNDFYSNPTTNYNPGGASCIVVVRVVYPMPAYLSIISGSGFSVSDNTAGQTSYNHSMDYLLMSTAVFENEPFPTASSNAAC